MKKWQVLGTTVISASLILGACGGAGQSNDSKGNDSKGSDVEGSVKGNGSSTVAPIIEKLNENFSSDHKNITVENVTSGTGDGFKQFIAGKTDFSNASRPIKDEEKNQLKDKNIDYTEFEIAKDGLTIAVNKDNDFVKELSLDDLKKIYSGQAKKWSDINSKYPNKEIKAFSPDQSHGTYDFFSEEVMNKQDIKAEKNQNTDVIVKSVQDNPNGIGFFAFNFYKENEKNLKAVKIKDKNGKAISPDHKTIQDGSYPLSRPLFIYANNEKLKKNDAFAEFLKYTLEDKGKAAESKGVDYVALPKNKYEEQMKKLNKLTGDKKK
ncbi:PstS family phosphate ABC transporter substrate-binding protein [Staphylococcus coagulans]|uniref:PstS family phosphate ABC transporter substrate-binding protein n=1 Tax=Staphylococcus coagulans TaxID=74706 RepID=UPI0015F9E988|nr:PstS family phosphate ABC transporter substrate-binding protein [Staphylococcus coagulans]MBA8758927.1 phosphate ABC transporter substrate-binding protein PstS family protein [Staphylococcus coagulans]MBA8761774.1 phosphate ABC transporter substrate-binding protein PstS family protein [Staphylococcus coagulans]MBA8768294.1 phosphate ABC transporter substrate-binding protein PstS family protein [Staphylococcus coagulans]